MNRTVLAIIAIVVVLAGGYWYMQSNPSAQMMAADEFGTYPYACANGVEFTMSPSADMSTITLRPGANASFSATTLAQQEGARYEGGGMRFAGAGEEVTLTIGTEAMVCNPVPSQDAAPFNWGDAGEGGGSMQPDAALVVTESIQGKWQSVDDAKFVREFKAGDKATDWYDNESVSEGLWIAFTKASAPEVPYPLQDNVVYLQMTMAGTQADTLYFKVNKLTPEELELTYMDRGGVLRFTYVK